MQLPLRDWAIPRVLELTYTAWTLQPFARDCGYAGSPFRWDEARRFLLRCELDAAYFHLYGIARHDVDYIMETFPIVRRKDEAQHGEYRTKRVILEICDAMQQAVATGRPYETRLDPPPAPGFQFDPGRISSVGAVHAPPARAAGPSPSHTAVTAPVSGSALTRRPDGHGATSPTPRPEQPAQPAPMALPAAEQAPAAALPWSQTSASGPGGAPALAPPGVAPFVQQPLFEPSASSTRLVQQPLFEPEPPGPSTWPVQQTMFGAAPPTPFVVGQRVRHPAYGDGQVAEVHPSGQDQMVTVQFDTAGTKRFLSSMAKLERA